MKKVITLLTIALLIITIMPIKVSAQCSKPAMKNDDDYARIKAIHDGICDYVEYGGGGFWTDMFLEGEGVCLAYADAFTHICQMAGYDCMTISGYAPDGESAAGHAWNAIKLDDDWYYVDVTWDDGEEITYDYFLKGKKTFCKDHLIQRDEKSMYPLMSYKDYNL